MLISYVATKAVRVRETLRASTFSYTDDAMLFRMKYSTLR